MNFNPRNILVINFGQIGDVILSLPALKAVREKFPAARITALTGKSAARVVEICGFVDEKITVDRVLLRDSRKLWSIAQIFKIAADIRRRKFDFVIDLHSLYETNSLGFVSGARHRLYAKRGGNRSLDFLANFQPKPPAFDRTKHLTEHYLAALEPLEIENPQRFVKISPPETDFAAIENLLEKANPENKKIVGIFPGAGNASRRWRLENFARLAKLLSSDASIKIIVFLGPEETDLRAGVEEKFPPETIVSDDLSLSEFAAALSKTTVLVSNDTSAAHLAAVVGTALVLVIDESAPTTYLPLAEKIRIINNAPLSEIAVEDVFQKTRNLLAEL